MLMVDGFVDIGGTLVVHWRVATHRLSELILECSRRPSFKAPRLLSICLTRNTSKSIGLRCR